MHEPGAIAETDRGQGRGPSHRLMRSILPRALGSLAVKVSGRIGSRDGWTARERGLYGPPVGLRGLLDSAGPGRGAALGALRVALERR